MRRTNPYERNAMRILGKILKFIVIAYVAFFALMLAMVMMTNMMLAGMGS